MRLKVGMIFSSWVTTMIAVVEFLRQAVEDFHHGERTFAVERRGRLVGEDDRRLVGERACDRHPLLLAAGEFGDARLRAVLHVERGEHLQRDGARLGVGYAGQHRQQRDVVGGVEKRDQVGAWNTKPMRSRRSAPQVAGFPAVCRKSPRRRG